MICTCHFVSPHGCPTCDQIAVECMTEGEMIIQGLREAVDWSRKPDTQGDEDV